MPIVAAAALGLCAVSLLATFVFPGNYLTPAGLGPITVVGAKTPLFGRVIAVVGVFALGVFVVLVAAAYAGRRRVMASPAVVFLVVLAVTQALPILTFAIYDRYYLPVLAVLLPLLAALASRGGMRAAEGVWPVLAMVTLGLVYVAGEQDYLAWQNARERLATAVYAAHPAGSFFPGYEPYAVHDILPRYELRGDSGGPAAGLPSSDGPGDPAIVLLVTGRGDPRPGVDYESLVPGRIVVDCRRGPCPAVAQVGR